MELINISRSSIVEIIHRGETTIYKDFGKEAPPKMSTARQKKNSDWKINLNRI
jgi:hypothetical protein